MATLTGQRSFDDLGTPLSQVTFCVIDVETTGGRPEEDEITEIGAVRLRGGECLGTFGTLVDPGRTIPPRITVLTGITDTMVRRAPALAAVLPALVEFTGDAVVVGHNVRFDLAFLRRGLERAGWPALSNRRVDTLPLARRFLAGEVPDHRLETLADRLRLAHRPTHRALDDALATGHLLHALLERAAAFGVLGLDDLLAAASIDGHPQAAKLRLTVDLPRAPGVYLFRDRDRRVLYVGQATDLRARVRSYFSSDRRRKVAALLREVAHVEHRVLPGPLEREVTELRLIQEHQPRFNRQGRRRSPQWLKLTLGEEWPRLAAVRVRREDGGLYLGPFRGRRAVDVLIDAIHTAVPLRRCTERPSTRRPRAAPCAPAQLGVATCPCAGAVTAAAYAAVVETVVTGLGERPELLVEPLQARMRRLADEQRFEEAAAVRNRGDALLRAVERHGRLAALRAAGRVVISTPDGGAELCDGRLALSWSGTQQPLRLDLAPAGPASPLEEADEVACVASWLERNTGRYRLDHAARGWWWPASRPPAFTPVER